MRYVKARIEEYQREFAYRIFVTNSLQLIPQNKYTSISYSEFINNLNKPIETKTAEEVVLEVMASAGLKFED